MIVQMMKQDDVKLKQKHRLQASTVVYRPSVREKDSRPRPVLGKEPNVIVKVLKQLTKAKGCMHH